MSLGAWAGLAISAVAAWLLWDERALWFSCAVGTGMIQLLTVRAMQNQRNEGAGLDGISDWIAWVNMIAFIAACGLFIAGFII